MMSCLLMVCVLTTLVWSITGQDLDASKQQKFLKVPHITSVIYPWRNSSHFLVEIMENVKTKQITIKVKSDKFVQGQGFYKLAGPGVDQEPKDMLEIDEIRGEIWNINPVDRETHQDFIMKVWAVSPSGHLLENPVPLKIKVLDMNDNRPVFTKPVFYGSVPELSPDETIVMRVSATDADDPETLNADLIFMVNGEETIPPNVLNKRIFDIWGVSGNIDAIAAVPPREVVKVFKLRLWVGDIGGAGLTDEAVAIIYVTDINNHVPEFSPTSYHMTVVENTLGDIGRVNMTDGDEPGTGNWEAKFSISDDPHGYFTIRTDAETNQGILSVVKPLDFETVTELNLTLRVENIKPLSSKAPTVPVSTATVIVTVVNDNKAPYFSEDPIQIRVPENVLPGTSLKSDIAVDPENLGMCFEITEDPEDWLDINKDTGEISTKRRLNMSSPHVQEKVYTAGVKVTDAGGLSSTVTVQITLVETNDFAPQLSPLSGSVCKNGGNFSSGLVLTAVDEDLPPHAEPFSFEIPEDMSVIKWNVAQVNGTHAVLQPGVDLESGVYQVTVMVSDSGTPTLKSSAQVNVTLCECDSSGDCQSVTVLDSGMGVWLITLIVIAAVTPVLILLALLVRRALTTRGEYNFQPREDDNPVVLLSYTPLDVGLPPLTMGLEAPKPDHLIFRRSVFKAEDFELPPDDLY